MTEEQIEQVQTLVRNIGQMFSGVDSDVVGSTLASLMAQGVYTGCINPDSLIQAAATGVKHLAEIDRKKPQE